MEAKFLLDSSQHIFNKLQLPSCKLEDIEKEVLNELDLLFQTTKVPILSNNDDVPYEESDFAQTSQICERNLSLVEQLLQGVILKVDKTNKCSVFSDTKATYANCIILAAQHSNHDQDWCTTPASQIASRILSLLLEPSRGATGWEILEGKSRETSTDTDEILIATSLCEETKILQVSKSQTGHNYRFESSLKYLLLYLSKHFTKTLWKNDPGCQELLLWLLYNLHAEDLSEQLGYLLPGVLLLLDDWECRHKVTALKALLYIINNVAGSELRCYGRAEVMYEAAKHHLYSRDPELLQAAYPAATAAAAVLLQDPSAAHSAQLSAPEEVLSMLLRDMTFEQRLDLRSVYAASLPLALAAASIWSVRWQEQVVPVLCNYLTTYEGAAAEDRLNALKALQVYCEHCWPQAGRCRGELLKALLQLVYSSSAPGTLQLQPQVQEAVLEQCKKCVKLLMTCKPLPDPGLLTGVCSVDLPQTVHSSMITVFREYDNCSAQ